MAHIAGARAPQHQRARRDAERLDSRHRDAVPVCRRRDSGIRSAERPKACSTTTARAQNQPKVFYTNSAVEYWGGRGPRRCSHHRRRQDRISRCRRTCGPISSPARSTRPAQFPPRRPTDSSWTTPCSTGGRCGRCSRRWIAGYAGARRPRASIRHWPTARSCARHEIAFPADSRRAVAAHRHRAGARTRKPLPFLVPQVDEDGNERAGVRTPEHAVPVATYTGWNFRSPAIGAPTQLVSLMGSSIPFAADAGRRPAGGRSAAVAGRALSFEGALSRAGSAAVRPAGQGTLPAGARGRRRIMKRMDEQWTLAAGPTSQAITWR